MRLVTQMPMANGPEPGWANVRICPARIIFRRAAETGGHATSGGSKGDTTGGTSTTTTGTSGGSAGGSSGGGSASGSRSGGGGAPAAKKTKFFGTVDLGPIKAKLQFSDVAEEVLMLFTQRPGVKVRISVKIEAESPSGFDDVIQRATRENCDQLKFKK